MQAALSNPPKFSLTLPKASNPLFPPTPPIPQKICLGLPCSSSLHISSSPLPAFSPSAAAVAAAVTLQSPKPPPRLPPIDFSPLIKQLSSSPSSPSSDLDLAELYLAGPAHQWNSLFRSLSSSPSTLPSAATHPHPLPPTPPPRPPLRHSLLHPPPLPLQIPLPPPRSFSSTPSPPPLPLSLSTPSSPPPPTPAAPTTPSPSSRSCAKGSTFCPITLTTPLIIQSLLSCSDPPDNALLLFTLSDFTSQSIESDVRLLSDLILAFLVSGDPDRTLLLLAVAQAQGLIPKSPVVVALISALGGMG